MCWSIEVSITSWLVGWGTSWYLWKRNNKNDIILALLIFVYSTLQLAEALQWLDQPPENSLESKKLVDCGNLNKLRTYLAYLTLWLHPLAIGYGIYLTYGNIEPVILGMFVLVTGIFLMPKMKCSFPKENSKGHLVWGFGYEFYVPVFAIAMGMCLYYIRPLSYALIIAGFYLTSLLVAFWVGGKNGGGSVWCWLAAVAAPLAAALTFYCCQ